MKIRFRIYPDKKLIVAVFKGPVVYEDILQWFNEAREHPDFSSKYKGLVDFRNAVFGTEDREQPRKMAQKAEALAEYMVKIDFTSAKWALLADSPVETSLSMLYSHSASQKHPMETFSTVQAAEDYLEVSLEDAIQDLNK